MLFWSIKTNLQVQNIPLPSRQDSELRGVIGPVD